MPSSKPRLQVALYARGTAKPGDQDTYRWALLVTPKLEHADTMAPLAGQKYHITNTQPVQSNDIPPWQYITLPLPHAQTPNLLIRITVAKVTDLAQLEHTLSQIPLLQNNKNFTCRTWVADAIAALDLHSPG